MAHALFVGIVASLALSAGAADAQTPPGVTSGAVAVEQPKAPVPTQPPAAPDALFAIPTRLDRIGRIVVPIMVNGRGPFQFVLDTGANATVISPHLAATLGLQVDATHTVLMNGVTGAITVPTVQIDQIQTRGLEMSGQRLAVSDASGVGTDGVLGVDALKERSVLVNFNEDQVEVFNAREHRPSDSLARVAAKLRLGNLLIVDVMVGTHKVKAVIDTGGQRTLGNPLLYEVLGYRHEIAEREAAADVIGATDARQPGERHVVHSIKIGEEMRVANLVVTFGDFYIFKLWDLQSQPALVIGMDMIGTLGEFGVDYFRREVQFRVGQQIRKRKRKSSS
jgi:predicted aspartyl protease